MKSISIKETLLLLIISAFGIAFVVPFRILLGPVQISLYRILFICVIIIAIGYFCFYPRVDKSILKNSIVITLGMLILLTFLSSIWSLYPMLTLRYVLDLLIGFCNFFLLIYSIRNIKEIKNLTYRLCIIIAIFLICYTLYFQFTGGFYSKGTNQILDAVSSNFIAQTGVFILPLLVGSTFERNSYYIIFVATLIFFIVLSILATGSRSGFIGICILFLLFFLVLNKFEIKTFIRKFAYSFYIIIPICIIGFVILGNSFLNHGVNRINKRLMPLLSSEVRNLEQQKETLGTSRYIMYLNGVKVIRDNWQSGIGYGSFKKRMESISNTEIIQHNVFMRFWLGTGILGFILLSLLFFIVLKNTWKLRNTYTTNRNDNFFVRMVGIAIIMQFIMGLANPIFFRPWIYLGLAIFASNMHYYHKQTNTDFCIKYLKLKY